MEKMLLTECLSQRPKLLCRCRGVESVSPTLSLKRIHPISTMESIARSNLQPKGDARVGGEDTGRRRETKSWPKGLMANLLIAFLLCRLRKALLLRCVLSREDPPPPRPKFGKGNVFAYIHARKDVRILIWHVNYSSVANKILSTGGRLQP